MSSTDRTMIVIFLITVAVRMAFHLYTGFTADDAFITFRYAENLASGEGFVYNIGQRVLGTSTPLFTVLLAAFGLISLSTPSAALLVSLICSGLTATLIYRLALLLRFTRLAIIPVVCYILWPRSIPADTSGMETAFFTLLIISAFYFHHRRLDIYAIGVSTLAFLTRPEGFWLLVLIVAANIRIRPDRWKRYIITPLLLIVPWLVFAQFYFGSVIPNSVPAKLALYSQFGSEPILDKLVYLLGLKNPVGWIMLAAAIPGAWWLNKKQNYGWLEIIWLFGMVAFYTFSRSRLFFWYIVPIYPIYLLVACGTLPMILNRSKWLTLNISTVQKVTVTAAVAVLCVGCYSPVKYYKELQTIQRKVHREIGIFLNARADRYDIVASEDIGYMGYYSRRLIVDRDGLVSPEIVVYNREGEYGKAIAELKPDWVVATPTSPISGFVTDSVFVSTFTREVSYDYGGHEYIVFSRK